MIAERQRWMAALAHSTEAEIRQCLGGAPPLPRFRVLRGPEVGLTMIRGKAGGDGAPFNLVEATVTRSSVAVSDQVGHAYILGRRPEHAELAAVLDAVLQVPETWQEWMSAVIHPLERLRAASRAERAQRAASTRVQFLTMATMR